MKFMSGIIMGIFLTLATFYYFGNNRPAHMQVETMSHRSSF